jgi:hypothetical protein
MKNYVYSFSLVMLLGIFSSEAFAYDIEVVNADGVKYITTTLTMDKNWRWHKVAKLIVAL